MANYLSAGVYVKEIDNSAIVPSVSTSMAYFAGNFTKGPIEEPFVITNKSELEFYYGKPTDKNYREWFQCSKYFDYSNQLIISRAYTEGNLENSFINTGETNEWVAGSTIINRLDSIDAIYVGTIITFRNQNSGTPADRYVVKEIILDDMDGTYTISFNRIDENNEEIASPNDGLIEPLTTNSSIWIYKEHQNAGADAHHNLSVLGAVANPTINQNFALYKNEQDFDYKKEHISIPDDVKLKFIAKTAGSANNNINIAIVNSYDFYDYYDSTIDSYVDTKCEAFKGQSILNYFEYPPVYNEEEGIAEIGIVIQQGDNTESFIVSFDEAAVDGNNRSKYIENVINEGSNIVNVIDNKSLNKFDVTVFIADEAEDSEGRLFKEYSTYIYSSIYKDSQGSTSEKPLPAGTETNDVFGPLNFFGGESPLVTESDLYDAYFEVIDKELYEIDIVIGNSEDDGAGAISLAKDRADCIAFVGARYEDVVGKKSAVAVQNLVDYILRNQDSPLERTMFAAFFGNYHRIYDNFAKKYRWIPVAGDMAGLRSNTNTNQASWWASAGLRRGVIRNIDKISFSPNQAQRDQLYKNNINPIVSFPGEGNLCWGQKTLLNYSSSFDRVNVRGLFNTIERAMAKAAKSTVFEFNDPFTRNAVLAMFNPYLSSVKAGRGIADFKVICDTTNNTPDVISRNELMVDIYIKPAYAAEFIQLSFNNVGTRSFSSVIGA